MKSNTQQLHEFLKQGIGSNYYGPVEDVLAEDTLRGKSAGKIIRYSCYPT
jgi:hypothetical protein